MNNLASNGMRYKIFLGLIVFIFTLGSITLADYVEPASSAPGGNTGALLMTGPNATRTTYEKIGTFEFVSNPPSENAINNLDVAKLLKGGSYAGDETGKKGLFTEKLIVLGATKIISGDLITMVLNTSGSFFDQFTNTTTFEYPKGSANKTAKPLEGIIAGRMLGKVALTDKEDDFQTSRRLFNPAYNLDLLATNTGTFAPTTNIGLGNSCNLYPADIGTAVDDGGGCPAGTYVSYYRPPTFSGTISASNNTNTQTIVTCTEFNPSIAPRNTGRCALGRPLAATVDWDRQTPDQCTIRVPSGCTIPSLPNYYYRDSSSSPWSPYSGTRSGDCSIFPSGRQYAFDGTCTSGPVYQSPMSLTVDSYKSTTTLYTNNSVLKMPSTLNSNIRWYSGTTPTEIVSNRDKTQIVSGANRVRVTDSYGQYVEIVKP